MTAYDGFEIDDFASDDYFIRWCLQSDEATDVFWQAWLAAHPEQQAAIAEARQLVLDLHSIEAEEHEANLEKEIWKGIEGRIDNRTDQGWHLVAYWRVVATVALLLSIGLYLWLDYRGDAVAGSALAETEWINLQNNSAMIKRVALSDESVVLLEPFSSLKYPAHFTGEQRAVVLQGEAFFDIARDTMRPFIVYANETVTKVLGTSFRIIAFEGQQTVEVEVATGKVAVYANVAMHREPGEKKQMIVQTDERIVVPLPNKKLEVTPNQRVVFDKDEELMIRMVAEEPQVITDVEQLPQFQFDEAPVAEVFEALELAYGIDLIYDAALLRNCTITTKLRSESLFQKLNIICAALGLTHTEQDAVIYISGTGC